MKNVLIKSKQPIFYIILSFALICWIFLFVQIISDHIIFSTQKTIPAFQPIANDSYQKNSMVSYPVSAFSDSHTNKLPNPNTIYNFLKQYDKEVRLISYQKEKNYTDLYFYSPILQNGYKDKISRNFNIQVAITKNKVYFGTPFLQYDF